MLQKGGGGIRENEKRKGGGVPRNTGLPYYIGVFLAIPGDAAWEKNLDVFIFPLLTKMRYKIIA